MRAVSTTSHDMGRKRCLREAPCKPRRNRSSVKNIGPTSHILRQTHIWTSVSVGDPDLAINHFSPTMKSCTMQQPRPRSPCFLSAFSMNKWVSIFFPVVLDMYWWKVALLRSIPPKHTPKHSPEAYPEANPQNEDHF